MAAHAITSTPRGRSRSSRLGRLSAFVSVALLSVSLHLAAQPAPLEPATHQVPDWETVAGGHMEFDVISIHPEKDPNADSGVNVPNGSEDTYADTGGVFRATNWPVAALIGFAFKTTTSQRDAFRASLPDWAQNEGFNIEARTDTPHVTKDQMRLMVRSMLIQRFGLKVSYQTRDVSVYAIEIIKPGVLGPGLRPHPAGDSCSGAASAVRARPAADDAVAQPATPATPPPPSYATLPDGFPIRCGTFVNMPPSQPYMRHEGGRNLTIAQIESTFTGMGALGRPVVDQTGPTGTYDWVMEFIDEREGHVVPPDAEGLNFAQALEKQLGLKLVSTKAPFQFLIVDHVERPSGN